MRRMGYYLGAFALLGSLMLRQNLEAETVPLAPPARELATSRKLAPEVRRSQRGAAPLKLEVQLQQPARPRDYMALWGVGARVIKRDYPHATASILLPPRRLRSLAALHRVEAVSMAPAHVAP